MISNLKFVINTHALIWHLGNSKKLPSVAKETLRSIDSGEAVGLIPTIVLAEATYIFEKGRTGVSLGEILNEIDKGDNYQIIEFDREQVELLPKLSQIPEMHDKMIVAVTQIYEAKLITKDREIHKSNQVRTIWS